MGSCQSLPLMFQGLSPKVAGYSFQVSLVWAKAFGNATLSPVRSITARVPHACCVSQDRIVGNAGRFE